MRHSAHRFVLILHTLALRIVFHLHLLTLRAFNRSTSVANMRIAVVLLAILCQLSFAIYKDEAGLVDYHLALLGTPGNSSTFFHQPVPGSKASLIYTLSERNVLGAVNPKDGSIVWRRPLTFDKTMQRSPLSTAEGQDVLYTGFNDTAYAYSASDGRFVWENRVLESLVKDVTTLSTGQNAVEEPKNKDVVILREGKKNIVQRLDADTGAVKWTFEDNSGNTPYRVLATAHGVHYVALSKAMLKGYKVHVMTLDASSGKLQDQVTLNSENEIMSESEFVHAGACGPLALLVWTDNSKSSFKANIAGSKNVASFDIRTGAEGPDRITVHSSASHATQSDFLVEFATSNSHWAQVFHVDTKKDPKKATISKTYDLPKLEGPGSFSTSTVGDTTYFVRLSSEIQLLSSVSHSILARWPLKLGANSPISNTDWQPVHAASEVVARPDSKFAVRSVVLQNTGDWVLVRNGDVNWNRPEQLSGIVAATWVTPNQSTTGVDDLEAETVASPVSAFLHRLQRHASALSTLSEPLQRVLKEFSRWLVTPFDSSATTPSKDHSFGFDRHVVALLEDGAAVIIDPTQPTAVRKAGKYDTDEIRRLANSDTSNHVKQDGQGFWYKIEDFGVSGKAIKGNLWYFPLRSSQNVISVLSANSGEPIASIGKVLGDRSVLYKYLNPNAILILISEESTQELSVYLLEAVSGAILYSTHHGSVDFNRPITSIASENWFAYTFSTDANKQGLSVGHELVMAECYESSLPNDRGPLGASNNYSAVVPPFATAGSLKPHVITQTYHITDEITHMTASQTGQGISSRELIVTLSGSRGIVGIPHHVLDPRRPHSKPTNQQLEEGLIQYHPVIDFDPKWYLTASELLGVTDVISSPSDMESTSLILAYGLDVFGTRVAPSFAFDILGPSFNKIQLVLTVGALTAGVFIVAPLINRKQTNSLWQVS